MKTAPIRDYLGVAYLFFTPRGLGTINYTKEPGILLRHCFRKPPFLPSTRTQASVFKNMNYAQYFWKNPCLVHFRPFTCRHSFRLKGREACIREQVLKQG